MSEEVELDRQTADPREVAATRAPQRTEDFIACLQCDQLYQFPQVKNGERARCLQCGSELLVNTRGGIPEALALTIAAFVLLVISVAFPFMTLNAAGLVQTMTLFDGVEILWEFQDPILASAVFAFVIGLPFLICLSQLYVLLPLMFHKKAPFSRLIYRFSRKSAPWSMAEVFFLGVLVSLMKLLSLAQVKFEIAFWSFAALMFCLTAAVNAVDQRELWRRLNRKTV